jgi:hypothetical protein
MAAKTDIGTLVQLVRLHYPMRQEVLKCGLLQQSRHRTEVPELVVNGPDKKNVASHCLMSLLGDLQRFTPGEQEHEKKW